MIFDIDSTGGLIRIGSAAILWQNKDEEYPGFTTLSWGDASIELGDIDAGNGIHFTCFKDGEIEYQRTLLKIS